MAHTIHCQHFQPLASLPQRSRPRIRRPTLHCKAAAAVPKTPSLSAQDLKTSVVQLCGAKYGHDLPAPVRQEIEDKVKALEALQIPVKADMGLLTGSQWVPVYTTSTGTSSGKVGPFITDVIQEFPAGEPGVYYNISRLGLVEARLRGEYRVTKDDRIDLEFKSLSLSVGPFKAAEKIFDQGAMQGFWKITYCDADFRVFYSNKDNLFVLRRTDPNKA